MTSWATDKDIPTSPVVEGRADDDPARLTPYCDEFCIRFYDVRLHTIACDIKNQRDPFSGKQIDRDELRQAIEGTPYQEEEVDETDV